MTGGWFEVQVPSYPNAGAYATINPKVLSVGYRGTVPANKPAQAGKVSVTVLAAADANFATPIAGYVMKDNGKILGPLNQPLDITYDDLYSQQDPEEYRAQMLANLQKKGGYMPGAGLRLDPDVVGAGAPFLPFYRLWAIPTDCYQATKLAHLNPVVSQMALAPMVASAVPVKLAEGTLMQAGSTGTVYILQNGQRRWVPSADLFTAWGFNVNQAQRLPDATVSLIPLGPDLTAPPPKPVSLPPITMDTNIDRRGMDYKDVEIGTAAQCQATCQGDPNCKAYSFGTPQALRRAAGAPGHCWLKSNVPAPSAQGGFISGMKMPAGPPPIAPAPTPPAPAQVLTPIDQNRR
jgi:hypothetical protein